MVEFYDTLSTQKVLSFTAEVHSLTQERMTKLEPYVIQKDFQNGVLSYNRSGQMARPRKNDQRFQDVELTDFAWDRRWKSKQYYYIALGIDFKDEEQVGRALTPEMVKAATDSINREVDKIIYGAVEESVKVGATPAEASDVTATTDGVDVIDATAGFGLDTLQELKQSFGDDGVLADMMAVPGANGYPVDLLLTVNPKQTRDLLGETQLTSIDYVNEKPLVDGSIGRAYGLNLIEYAPGVTDPLMPAASSERRLISIAKGGICMGFDRPEVIVEQAPGKIKTKQVLLLFACSALRTEGPRVKVVRVAA